MSKSAPKPDRLIDLAWAFRASKAFLSAVELGVFTAVAAAPLSASALAAKVGIAERGARDFFDALVSLQLLERGTDGRYCNSAEADFYLDRAKATYIGGDMEHANARIFPAWQKLTAALRTGGPATSLQPEDFYNALYEDPGSRRHFVSGMTGSGVVAARAIAAKPFLSAAKSVLDVGAAEGALLVELARCNDGLFGIGFDLPQVRAAFEEYVAGSGYADRLSFRSGNFLSDNFPQADLIIMGRVLHNWNLEIKRILLAKAYTALPPGGRIVVYERFIDDDRRRATTALLASLNMLIMTPGGFDFTVSDCIAWMAEAQFVDIMDEPLAGDLAMITGCKPRLTGA